MNRVIEKLPSLHNNIIAVFIHLRHPWDVSLLMNFQLIAIWKKNCYGTKLNKRKKGENNLWNGSGADKYGTPFYVHFKFISNKMSVELDLTQCIDNWTAIYIVGSTQIEGDKSQNIFKNVPFCGTHHKITGLSFIFSIPSENQDQTNLIWSVLLLESLQLRDFEGLTF